MADTIEDALVALSDRDQDYASTVNGVGYNGRDTVFGNDLASRVRAGQALSPRQLSAAYNMLATYRRQLLSYGVDYDNIEAPDLDGLLAQQERRIRERAEEIASTPFGHIELRGDDSLALVTRYHERLVDRIRALPLRRWSPDEKVWLVPLSPDTIQQVSDIAKDYSLEWTEEARSAVSEESARFRANQRASKALKGSASIEGLAVSLLPFQKAGVDYAISNVGKGGVYIADEMGLGKTIQALAVLEATQSYPAVVVVPKTVWMNWAKETVKVLPSRKAVLMGPAGIKAPRGVPEQVGWWAQGDPPPDAEIFIINYDNLGKWREPLEALAPQGFVLDEAHMVKSHKAQRTKLARELAKHAKVRLALSGTPFPNRPAELISPLMVLGRLDDVGGFRHYWNHYCEGDRSGARDLDGLNQRLRATCYVRRRKADVLTELPPVRWDTIPTQLRDRKRYQKVQADLVAWFREQVAADTSVKPENVNSEALLRWHRTRAAETLVRLNALRQVVAEEKIPATLAWVSDFLAGTDEKLLLFTWHRKIGQSLAAALDAPLLVGGMKAEQKNAYEEMFQTDPSCRVLVSQIMLGGVGLTLTAASNVAFAELPWRPMDLDQAVARCYGRLNDIHGANAYLLVAPDTIEARMAELISTKRQITDQASDGSSVIGDLLTTMIGS